MEQVSQEDFEIDLEKAEVLKEGSIRVTNPLLGTDVTLVGYGSQIYSLEWAIALAEKKMKGLSCELIDLRTIMPYDIDAIVKVLFLEKMLFNPHIERE